MQQRTKLHCALNTQSRYDSRNQTPAAELMDFVNILFNSSSVRALFPLYVSYVSYVCVWIVHHRKG